MAYSSGNIAGITFLVAAAAGCLLVMSPASAHNCTCRNRDGRVYQLGQSICLFVDGRRYLARCDMSLNVSSWTKLQDGCPSARLSIPEKAPQTLYQPTT